MTRLTTAQAAGVTAVIAAAAILIVLAILPGLRDLGARPTAGGPALGSPPSTTATETSGIASRSPSGPLASGGATRTATPGPVVLVGAGDIAVCGTDGDAATADLLDEIEGTVFTLGDNAYENGSRREFEECYAPTWGRHLGRTRPSPGNHEYNTAGAAGYYGYFGARGGDPDKGYYAYDHGAWRIYSLNSNCRFVACDEASTQVAWLRDDMLANPRRCTLAYWHHPRYSSGRHGDSASTQGLWSALYEAGAEIVLAGHDHGYERFAPMDAAGNLAPDRGIVSFVVGTGGRGLYEFHDIRPTSQSRNAAAWGVLELTLSADGWSSRFVPVAGKSFTDGASGTCN